jgi:hypothetical protein
VPIKSIAQLKRLQQLSKEGKISNEQLKEWEAGTPDLHKLPKSAPKQPTGTIRGPRKSRRTR